MEEEEEEEAGTEKRVMAEGEEQGFDSWGGGAPLAWLAGEGQVILLLLPGGSNWS